ncbi:MAG: hypothetical protein LC645_06835 [Geobacteraceae bacterium]|nr:hypothetical protein [Geobacteraceae bacterium]
MEEKGIQGSLWEEHEFQEKEPDFKTWVKANRAPDLWRLTWEKCVELCHCGGSMISWEGHIIAGRDKPLEQVGKYQARAMYLHTLKMAYRSGKEIPQEVLDAEAGTLGI